VIRAPLDVVDEKPTYLGIMREAEWINKALQSQEKAIEITGNMIRDQH